MRTLRTLAVVLATALGALIMTTGLTAAPAAAEPPQAGEHPRALAERMNQLGSETLGRLVGPRGTGTVVVSPYGLGSALHLLLLGAAGSAEKSLQAKLLPPGVEVGKQDAGLTALQQHVLAAGADKVKLTLSSAVFVPKSMDAAKRSQRFVARARDIFGAPIEVLDFKSPSALERINAWANRATNGLVPSILDGLDADARFVLTNAVSFKGAWETAFDAARTVKAPFTRVDGSTREVAMMAATMPAAFAEADNLQAVWLPYDGKGMAMLVIVPGAQQPPGAMAELLGHRPLADLVGALDKQRRMAAVHVRLPRFRAESKLELTETLSEQGLKAALDASANYHAISPGGDGPLHVVHRAVVEVAEAGTTAAAATAIVADRSLAVSPALSADRPFAFVIVHAPTQAILFAGYIADPGDAPADAKAVR
jgi:serpin B